MEIREHKSERMPIGLLCQHVLRELHKHDIEHPFNSHEYSEEIDISEPRIRAAIRELRLQHIRICSDPRHRGYWLEENGGGYDATRDQLLSRAFKILEVVKAMDNNQDGQLEWEDLMEEVS